MSQTQGYAAEKTARDYLLKRGLKWITSNYRCRLGEIDLIMQDKDCIVFVEVRARRSSTFGGAGASVTASKQQKLIRTASLYLMAKKLDEKYPSRFDVVSLEGEPVQINWIKHAFELNG